MPPTPNDLLLGGVKILMRKHSLSSPPWVSAQGGNQLHPLFIPLIFQNLSFKEKSLGSAGAVSGDHPVNLTLKSKRKRDRGGDENR